ncbi:restriction endonuclease subunit S [Helicobacter pylori]|uniref:restriction endonuclease subunit S n=2 Tax=Helicobacter pylori TaxID=210 RepID=UPI00040BC3C7|nr:restriction endonuclease subunit S [Helicobacter pylori]
MTKLLDLKNNSVIAINQNNYTKEDNYKKVCYLDTDNITNNRINTFLKIDLTKEKLPSRTKRKCSINSIIYSSVRPNQRHFGIIKEIPKNFLVSTAFIVIDIIDLEKLDPNYLYYYITQDEIIHYLQRIAECGTSSYPSITPLDFLNIKIKLYPLETQQKIARTLSVLDQKIENNHKINELIQTLAYKIYEYYFKHKPKNAKLEQIILENPKSSIMVKDAQKTQDKYPFFTSGDNILSYPKALIDGRNCFLNTGGNAGIKFYVGKASYSTDTWCICANEFSDYLYLLLSSIKNHINQSFFQGTSLKHLQKNLLKKYPIYMPSKHEIKQFNEIVMPLLTLISINTRTSKKLEQIRDFLLPLLLKQQVKPKNQKQNQK